MAYKKIKKLGEGAYGGVYQIANERGERLALKCLWVSDEISFCCSVRELDILSRLKHPYIIRLTDALFECPIELGRRDIPEKYRPDEIYFVMECGKINLYEYYKKKPDIEWETAKRWMRQALLAIDYAHRNGIIHRDLKPENIILMPNNDIKITDFGLSKPYTSQERSTPRLVTSWYRPPEIIYELKYDYKADIWSLAGVFYEMIFGGKSLFKPANESRITLVKEIMKKIPVSEPIPDNVRQYITHTSWDKWTLDQMEANQKEFQYPPEQLARCLDLFRHMLDTNPHNRYSAQQCLAHPFFADMIPIVPNPPIETYTYGEDTCEIREKIYDYVMDLYSHRKRYTWLKPRTLFFAIDLYELSRPLWTDLERVNELFYFGVCLYLSYKYFLLMEDAYTILELGLDPQIKKHFHLARDFEHKLLSYLNFQIYRKTFMECADEHGDVLTDTDIFNLLRIRLKVTELCGYTPNEIYSIYRKSLNDLQNQTNTSTSVSDIENP